MSALGILYLISLALVITLFFSLVLRIRGPWGSFWTFFVIILLAVLATDVWINPIGPYFEDIFWLPPLAVGILIAFLLAATTPSPTMRSRIEQEKQELAEERPGAVALGTFFWFLLVFMLVLVVLGYFNNV